MEFTPVKDSELGHDLNFRDPDGIALEFYAPNDRFAAILDELRSRNFSDEDLLDAAERLGLGRTSHGESDGSLANAAGPGKRAGRARRVGYYLAARWAS